MNDVCTINKIINCNYSVINTFDDHYDGYIGKYKTKDEAESIRHERGKRRNGYLTGCNIVHNQAIVGDVDFNGKSAYVFNYFYKNQQTNDDCELITAGSFDELKECYVFSSMLFSSKELKRLVDEYHNRGGYKFEKYHDYENDIFKPVRISKKQEFRTEIVEHIFKHQYQETKKLTWSNGKIKIKQVPNNCSSLKQHLVKTIMDLDVDIDYKIELNSIFGNYYNAVNILNNDIVSIPCRSKINTHSFVVFTVEKLKND
jgi:hypothetical protein